MTESPCPHNVYLSGEAGINYRQLQFGQFHSTGNMQGVGTMMAASTLGGPFHAGGATTYTVSSGGGGGYRFQQPQQQQHAGLYPAFQQQQQQQQAVRGGAAAANVHRAYNRAEFADYQTSRNQQHAHHAFQFDDGSFGGSPMS